MTRLRLLLVVGSVLVVLGAIGTWLAWDPALRLYWAWVASSALDEGERADVEACADVAWLTALKVLEQDLDTPCDELWVAERLAFEVTERRARWLDRVARQEGRAPRVRVRAATALLRAGRPTLPDLALVVSGPDLDAQTRAGVVGAVADGRLDGAWLDPHLEEDLALYRLALGDLREGPELVARLRGLAVDPGPDDRDRLVELALSAAGFPLEALDGLEARLADPRVDHPPGLARLIGGRLQACADPGTVDCATLAADLLEWQLTSGDEGWSESEDAVGGPQEPTGVEALWQARHGGDPRAVATSAALIRAVADWVAAAPEDDRPTRLLGATAGRRHRFTVQTARDGFVGDPVFAVRFRRSTPWTSALAASVIGRLASVPVEVGWADGTVVVTAGGRSARLGPCGTSPAPPEPPGAALDPWPEAAVLAQATAEAAGQALRAGDRRTALRLAVLAERTDPVGAEAASSLVPAGERTAGAVAGSSVRPVPPSTPKGAETARVAARATWSQTKGESGCPPVFGPG